MSGGGIKPRSSFTEAAKIRLKDQQLRQNLGFATSTIRQKRQKAVEEVANWQDLRHRGAEIKDEALANLEGLLLQLEDKVTKAGGHVHWASSAGQAVEIVSDIAKKHQIDEVVKVKSITSDEIELNSGLADRGIKALETDLAELICQLANDAPSHILVPAIHFNKQEIRDLFEKKIGAKITATEPALIAEAARLYLRETFLRAKMAVSGANFAVAETGTVAVVESEGNGRMCLTLPNVLVTIMGVEKVLPRWVDVATFLTLLPRSSTAERMNPYTSMWTGVTEGDGPQEFHLILLDNGRTSVLSDKVGRQTLRCIRCSACLNVCPVYEKVGGHAYGSVYPGPIGAILTPLLNQLADKNANSLPYASTLCGACYEVCPVKINIPEVLVNLRTRVPKSGSEAAGLKFAAWAMSDPVRFMRAIRLARFAQGPLVGQDGKIHRLPGQLGGWTSSRDMHALPSQCFREWWEADGRQE